SMSSFFFGRLTDWVLRRRGAVAVLIVLLTAFFLWKMQDLQFDNSNEIWFSEGDPSLERINTFHKLFGNDDFVYLVFDADTLFSPESLRLLSDLVSDIRKKVPYLRDVTWLGNAERIEADAEGIVVSDFIDPETYDAASMPELRRRALAEKNYRDNLISSDGKTVGMLLEMRTYPRDSVEPRSEVTHALRGVLAQPEYAGFSIHAVGQPILHNDYNELSFKESATFFGLCLLIQMVLLFWLGKGVRGVIGPISVVVLSVIWTLGMIQVLGFTLNLFIILIPTLLICVCIGDSMHIIATYNQHCREGLGAVAALRQAMSETGMPCLLTSLTTAAGFLGFCAADIQPFREMGVYASVGALMAYILSILVVLLLYSTERDKAPSAPTPGMPGAPARTASPSTPIRIGTPDIFDRFLGRVYLINVRYPKVLLALFVVLLGVSVYGYTLVEGETGTARMLSKSLPLRQAYDFVDERMGGSMSVEIMLDTGRENGVKSQAFLRGLERLQQHLDVSPLVTKTVSVLDIIKKINESMHGGDKAAYALPDGDDAAIAQYLLLYEMSDGRELDKLVSFDSRVVRLTAKTRTLGTGDVRRLSEDVAAFSRGVFGDTVKVRMAGNLDWTKSMNDLLADGQRQSFLAALLVVSVIMCFALGSLRLGLLRCPTSSRYSSPSPDGGVRDLHGHAAHELQRDHHRGGGRRHDTLPVSLPRILRPHRLL
ncbi:MAG: efflux RND transporter permease subunit, partial [Bilophila wadsworthia]